MDKDSPEDKASTAEGQIVTAYDRMPESLRSLSDDELHALNRQIVRKVDPLVLPTVGILYMLNYIDRQNLAAAKLQGLMDDLHMDEQQFATAVSILFVGYLPLQIPSNRLITKISRPGMYICLAVLLAVRAILGAAEAVFFPGAIYYLSAWYTKLELGKRIAALYVAQQVGNAFGGLFAAAILQLDGAHSITGWQRLFILEGSLTVGIGIICALIMPEFPNNSRILTPAQRTLAVHRIESEAGAAEGSDPEPALSGFIKAHRDPELLLVVLANMLSQTQGSIANYFPTLVASLDFSETLSLLLTAPSYILAAAVYYAVMYYSDARNTVYPLILVCVAISVVMYIIPMTKLSVGARYTAMMILPFASRAAASALDNAIGGTSNIWASYLYYAPPRFYAAFGTLMGAALLLGFVVTGYRTVVRRENRRLESGEQDLVARVVKGVLPPPKHSPRPAHRALNIPIPNSHNPHRRLNPPPHQLQRNEKRLVCIQRHPRRLPAHIDRVLQIQQEPVHMRLDGARRDPVAEDLRRGTEERG
ncbi:major facilitator superfamily domain-containing protein [Aspergillus aurantiobrunneus]